MVSCGFPRGSLAADKSMVASVATNGRASVWRVLDPATTVAWTRMARHPSALVVASQRMPNFELTLYGSGLSGRSMVAHAAAAGNVPLLAALFDGPLSEMLCSTVLRCDCTGWHALDHALMNRNSRLAELMFKSALRLLPSARMGLVQPPPNGLPSLVLMARLFPFAVRRQLSALGLDPYMDENTPPGSRRPYIRRAPQGTSSP